MFNGEIRRPVNKQAAVGRGKTWAEIREVGAEKIRVPSIDELKEVPRNGVVGMKEAMNCMFTPKYVRIMGVRKWLEPMTWEAAFDAVVEFLNEWNSDAMQYLDARILAKERPQGVQDQWQYLYCIRQLCKKLNIDYSEIVFGAL